MARLVLLSDTHGLHRKVDVPKGDILIHAGDFMNSGLYPNEARSFAEWWNDLDFDQKILIGGNHDRLLEKHPEEVIPMFHNTHYLQDSGVGLFGLKFWGSPYTPKFFDWAFMRNRGEDIKKHWDLIPKDTDVLITHGPPFGILDQATPNSEHVGCEELQDAIHQIKPKLCIFGHIHGSYGQTYTALGYTMLVNASQVNEAYNIVNEPIVINLEGK